VPPIFQPEVAANAIVWAAEHAPRELQVGAPTELVIRAQKLFPGLLDRYLARSAWEGQMHDGPEDPHRPDNLDAPVEGDFGAHGTFDDRARNSSPQLWLETHPWVTRMAAAVLGVAAAARTGRSER
jgi:hypothetical protein